MALPVPPRSSSSSSAPRSATAVLVLVCSTVSMTPCWLVIGEALLELKQRHNGAEAGQITAGRVYPAPDPRRPQPPPPQHHARSPDPHDQLEVARKITAVAVAVAAHASRLRQKLADKDRLTAELTNMAGALDQAFPDADFRFRAVLEDNAKLVKERDSLVQTFKKLVSELAKLETFKRHLMQSPGDENSSSLKINVPP